MEWFVIHVRGFGCVQNQVLRTYCINPHIIIIRGYATGRSSSN